MNLISNKSNQPPPRWGRAKGRGYPVLALLTAALVLGFSPGAAAVDWGAVAGRDISLFYPGQSSWEWALTQADHSGAKRFRKGKTCDACHEGEQADMGALMVSGKKLEPSPEAGKAGAMNLSVKAAVADGRLHFHFEWSAPPPTPRPQGAEFEARVTVMLDDGAIKVAKRAGCWVACHDDLEGMPSYGGNDLTKYLAYSRTKLSRHGGGENYKTADQVAALLESGRFLEYWQAALNRGAPATVVQGYVLDKRHVADAGPVTASGGFKDGRWIVDLSRPLEGAGPGAKTITPTNSYVVGFAVHDGFAVERRHYVSFGYALSLSDGSATLEPLAK